MENSTQATDSLTNLVEIQDVAKSLGISTKQVRNLIIRKQIPQPIRVGNLIRWTPKIIESWIESGCQPCDSPENEAQND